MTNDTRINSRIFISGCIRHNHNITNMTIAKPLLAATLENLDDVKFPCFVTPKIDGIRSLKQQQMLSRTFKPIRNSVMNKLLSELLPEGADGEICIDDSTFQATTSAVMTGHKVYDEKFSYYWFDYVVDDPLKSYTDRVNDMKKYVDDHPHILEHEQVKIIPLFPIEINNIDELSRYEREVLAKGFEGVMIRRPDGKYKFGRSTLKEGILLKMKQFKDAEATIISMSPRLKNTNAKSKDNFGYSKRSTHKSGKVEEETMGSIEVDYDGVVFSIGTGFDDEQRKHFWENKDSYIGKLAKFKYFEMGSKDAPRFPVFLGIRHEEDC